MYRVYKYFAMYTYMICIYIYIHWYIHTYVHIYSYVCGLFSGESGGGGNPWWSNQTKLQGTFLFIGRCFPYLYPILIIVPEECPNYQLTKTPFWSLVQFFRGAKSLFLICQESVGLDRKKAFLADWNLPILLVFVWCQNMDVMTRSPLCNVGIRR